MASLSSGVLVKLLEDMGLEDETASDDRKPVLLQIRSIIPVLAEGNLWPNQGFYLKVSDSSHAIYVSLPHDQDDMILSNKLQLGQFISVQKLEAAYPVPILRGVTPVPGRRPCMGNPENLVAATTLKNDAGINESISSVEEKKTTKKKIRSVSASRAHPNEQTGSRRGLNSLPKRWDAERKSSPHDILKEIQKISSGFVGEGIGNSDILKSFSSSTAMRRSWNGVEITKVKEMISDSSVVKHENKPIARTSGACVSPIHSARYDSCDDIPSSKTRKKYVGLAVKSAKTPKLSTLSESGKTCETLKPAVTCSSANDRKGAETNISWDSAPPTLVELGKEVLRHRDVALLAAVEALQEASAAERLIRCLSTYSDQFQSSDKGENLQPSVDKFLDLQDDLDQTRLIVQSLTKISPLRPTDTDSKTTGSIQEVLEIAFERKKNATSWIKAAVSSDLSPFSAPSEHTTASTEATTTVTKSSTITNGSKPKGICNVKQQRKNDEIQVGLVAEKDDNPQDWVKGSALCAATELGNSLQCECRKWFLGYVENYLDGVQSKTISMESDSQIAATMMYQFKRVNDWLDMIVSKNGSKDSSTLEDSDIEACGRVKEKIYGVLLNHVEKTAMALENVNATAPRLSI
ncbi:hypothetical protein L1049_015672 [Liquidambar formosana]|uniref:Uncharacterized protein n=1 Tax=Liquidambar formosana TaxID=63359 RepID=A0AAP0WZY4_LIQFO